MTGLPTMWKRPKERDPILSEFLDAFPGLSRDDTPLPLVITRDFEAPRERVWRAWTQADALLQWHGPAFYPASEVTADVRVGGAWRACLRSDRPGEKPLWQSGRYLVVSPPERLEFTFAWDTPDHEDGPGVETYVIVRLEELPGGGTRMHFSQTGFLSVRSAISHSAGWNGTFDRLAEFLTDNHVQRTSVVGSSR